uniref:Uncharacterized protein n=1 Tax=Rhizophora mucronata TaxID=61149 RepID=A0A2P2IUC7_RHIMU
MELWMSGCDQHINRFKPATVPWLCNSSLQLHCGVPLSNDLLIIQSTSHIIKLLYYF